MGWDWGTTYLLLKWQHAWSRKYALSCSHFQTAENWARLPLHNHWWCGYAASATSFSSPLFLYCLYFTDIVSLLILIMTTAYYLLQPLVLLRGVRFSHEELPCVRRSFWPGLFAIIRLFSLWIGWLFSINVFFFFLVRHGRFWMIILFMMYSQLKILSLYFLIFLLNIFYLVEGFKTSSFAIRLSC